VSDLIECERPLSTIGGVTFLIPCLPVATAPVMEAGDMFFGCAGCPYMVVIPAGTQWRWTKLGRLPTPFRLHPHGQNLYRKREIRALSGLHYEGWRGC